MASAINTFVDFLHDTQFADLSNPVVHHCKRHFLDCTASALAAVPEPVGKIVATYVGAQNAGGTARVIGTGQVTSAEHAAFGNGILAHAISFDDSGPSHPSVTVVPALYALGDTQDLSGQDIIAAQALGYELFQRLNRVTNKARQMRDAGWHPTGFMGALTSAAIASRLLKLTHDQTIQAFGIVASMGAGLSCNIGTMTMALHAGNASRNGVAAAMLAQQGFTSDPNAITGDFGLLNALLGKGNYDTSPLVDGLGESFAVHKPGINIKTLPNCWGHHKYYQAMLAMVTKEDIQPEDVVRIDCDLQPDKSTCRYFLPQNDYEAKYSIGYGLAMALIDRELTFAQYAPDRITSPKVRSILDKINHVPAGHVDDEGKTRVTLTLTSGRVVSNLVTEPKGMAQKNPISDNELFDKFKLCASRTLSNDRLDHASSLIMSMEDIENFTSVSSAVSM
ncbi:MAG: MmgE/PrpD family protein [Cognatishimia sp.]